MRTEEVDRLRVRFDDYAHTDEDGVEYWLARDIIHGVTKMVCVDADLSRVPSVSATEAAERLGVSRPRVTQMVESGRLMGWRDGRNAHVSLDSLNARLAKRGDV